MNLEMPRLLPAAAAAVLAASIALVAAPRAEARTGPCVPGKKRPVCHFWKGKVTFVADGDTMAVDLAGDGTTTPVRVRITGINATEQTVYSRDPQKRRGECHALEATARLEQLVRGSRPVVRLAAQNPKSKSGGRLRRSVAVRLKGAWRDVGRILIDEGYVLWLPNAAEWAWNARYAAGSQRAAAAGRRLWNPAHCGSTAHHGTPLKMWVNWDADGTDGRGNLNGEWVKVKNTGSTDLAIGRWQLRDSYSRYTFPAGAAIPAGETITLFVGSRPATDTNWSTNFYWGRSAAVFDNVTRRTGMGDGGYLLDRKRNLRAWMIYPCRYRCSDPLRGKVEITAQPRAPEEVHVRNVSGAPVDLEGYVVDNPPYIYAFHPSTLLHPGERLRLVVIGSPTRDERLVKHWGKSKYILDDAGDLVRLRTQTNIVLDCSAWGSASC